MLLCATSNQIKRILRKKGENNYCDCGTITTTTATAAAAIKLGQGPIIFTYTVLYVVQSTHAALHCIELHFLNERLFKQPNVTLFLYAEHCISTSWLHIVSVIEATRLLLEPGEW